MGNQGYLIVGVKTDRISDLIAIYKRIGRELTEKDFIEDDSEKLQCDLDICGKKMTFQPFEDSEHDSTVSYTLYNHYPLSWITFGVLSEGDKLEGSSVEELLKIRNELAKVIGVKEEFVKIYAESIFE